MQGKFLMKALSPMGFRIRDGISAGVADMLAAAAAAANWYSGSDLHMMMLCDVCS